MIEHIDRQNICKIQNLTKKFPQILVDFPIIGQLSDNTFRQIFTVSDQNEVVGYMILDIIYERMELIQIETLKEKRNQGYANQMLKFMIEEAQKKELENITLEVREDNNIAIHLYEKYKFKQVAKRKNYYHGIDGILMERKMM